jgi:RecA/RadA recombinase
MIKKENIVTEFLKTGSVLLDAAISIQKDKYGGIPTRRVTEFSGTGASGKTYICGELCGDAIRKGYTAYVDDIERRWDLSRMDTFGIANGDKHFKYLDPSSNIEDCFARLFKTLEKLKKGSKLLYIIDPIAALWAKQELKSDKMSQARAKALQKHMRFLKDLVNYDNDIINTVVFSNQLIDNVGGGLFSENKTTPGGNALVHWPSLRVRFQTLGKITKKIKVGKKEFKKTIGVNIGAETRKNSEDDPFRTCEFSVRYGYGIDNIRDCAIFLRTRTTVLGKQAGYFKLPLSKKLKKKGVPQKNFRLNEFVPFIEEFGLEKRLYSLTRKAYKEWHKPEKRKPRVRY